MNTILAKNIKDFRKKIGLSQDELAEYLGISREEMNYYENAKRVIPSSFIPKLANLFGIDEYDLFEEDSAIIEVNMAFAFKANSISSDDLVQIASFKKIALNYLKLKNAVAANE